MNPQAIPVAVSAAGFVGALTFTLTRQWRRLDTRIDPYTAAVRSRADDGERVQILQLAAPPPTASGVLANIFGPMLAALASRLAAVAGHRDEAAVALALDRAGITGVTPRAYVYQQFTYAIIGLAAGVTVGSLRGVRAAVLMGICGGVFGAMRKRSELDRRTRKRQGLMRAELVDVCNLLSIYARATPNLQSVVATVCARGRGEIVGELSRVLAAIEGGTPPESAFAHAAEVTPEPAAGGLYRAMAMAITLGGDLAETLLAQAANLRDRQRDARRERATKRTQLIVASNASLMVLPLLVLIGAGIPYMILGSL